MEPGAIITTITGSRALGNAHQATASNQRFDLQDGNTSCDNNVWADNVFGTANPACIA